MPSVSLSRSVYVFLIFLKFLIMKKLDINQLEQINGGTCNQVRAIASAGAVAAAVTLNPALMVFCVALTLAAYQVC